MGKLLLKQKNIIKVDPSRYLLKLRISLSTASLRIIKLIDATPIVQHCRK